VINNSTMAMRQGVVDDAAQNSNELDRMMLDAPPGLSPAL